jgi:hypothetical protein
MSYFKLNLEILLTCIYIFDIIEYNIFDRFTCIVSLHLCTNKYHEIFIIHKFAK